MRGAGAVSIVPPTAADFFFPDQGTFPGVSYPNPNGYKREQPPSQNYKKNGMRFYFPTYTGVLKILRNCLKLRGLLFSSVSS